MILKGGRFWFLWHLWGRKFLLHLRSIKLERASRQVLRKTVPLWNYPVDMNNHGLNQKVARKAPAKARATARTLQVVALSLRKTVARMKMKMVLSWLRAEATEAKVYFIPPIQNISDR